MEDIDFAIYAGENTPYTIQNDMEDVMFKLQNSSKILFQSFVDNQMKTNQTNIILPVPLIIQFT